MSERRNGLYYESIGIRNSVLSRNIGEYVSYGHSMLENGGLAIGMPYANETELVPYPLSDRSMDGFHLNVAFSKDRNPKISMAWREGGLFGYTHEVINDEYDWISRNANLLQSYFDYDSTEELNNSLSIFPSSLPWGQNGFVGGTESGGLRAFSSHNDPQNSVYYDDYTTFIRSIFTDGVSFDKSLSDHYITNLLYDGFNKENVDNGVARFIDERSKYITDDIDAELKPIEDTKLAYIGRIMVGEAKEKQILADHRTSVSTELELPYRPGIKDTHFTLMGAGKSYAPNSNGSAPFDDKFIKDISDVVNSLSEPASFMVNSNPFDLVKIDPDGEQRLFLKRNVRKNRYNGLAENKYLNIITNVSEPGGGHSIDTTLEGVRPSDIYGGIESNFIDNVSVRTQEVYDERDDAFGDIRSTFDGYRYGEYNISGINTAAGDQNVFNNQPKSLLSKTQQLFTQHKIKTLVGRFHTSVDDPDSHRISLTQSAVDETFGISHGRNLLKGTFDTPNDYNNPYCRVWTYHHQYSRMKDLIRPFIQGDSFKSIEDLQAAYPGRPIIHDPARGSWSEKTVLNKNGMVNITPTKNLKGADRVRTKQCMFSIENLAWKNVHNGDNSILDDVEIGPLGGRIMWFPPYNLQFNESVSANWGSNDFIGRGERIYSYTNTERTGTLSFTILADHPSILDYWMNSDNRNNPLSSASEEDEQKVLRFFAGCDELEVSANELDKSSRVTAEDYARRESTKNEPKEQQDNTAVNKDDSTEETPEQNTPQEFTKENTISFYMYFPNNLSGIDYIKNPKVIVNYLVHGEDGFRYRWTDVTPGSDKEYLLPPSNVSVGTWEDNIEMSTPTSGTGYEMGGRLTKNWESKIMDHNGNPVNDNGHSYIWGYGIDKEYVQQRLCGPYGKYGNQTYKIYPENYCDTASYGKDENGLIKGLNRVPNEYDDTCDYSFMDVAEAITTDYNYSGKGTSKKVKKIKEILRIDGSTNNGSQREYFFAIAGGASIDGYENENDKLSRHRAAFLKAWLEDCFHKLNLKVDYKENDRIQAVTGIDGGDGTDVNSESAKRGRYAKAVIYWNENDTKDATNTDTIYEESNPEAGSPTTIKDTKFKATDNAKNTEEAGETTTISSTASLRNASATRYRDEEQFFNLLREESPVIYKNIVDKVKYFDPAYHSITPEGFNSRLSFLHQCTRQGPTMSSSDYTKNNGFNGAGYAGNLSFGRAPVCVLRLGDFFNTRIIINSLNIQYETAQWDLNPEGIGVQPMLANVTLGFTFQGGSSLGGPIQRLQNAVSFNYYANQEVYDDRADVAVYKNNEFSQEESLIWMPGYGNMNVGSVHTIMDGKDPTNETVIKTNQDNEARSLKTRQILERMRAIQDVNNANQ